MQANADIPVFEPHAEMNSIKKGLDEAGCAIILNAQSLASTQQVRNELFDSMDQTYLQDQDSHGKRMYLLEQLKKLQKK